MTPRVERVILRAVIAPFMFDSTWHFDVAPERLWAQLSSTDQFTEWWTWLVEFDAADGLRAGTTANAVIRAPLPYVLRLSIDVERVVERELVETYVRGDLDGVATLVITPTDEGCAARLNWELHIVNGMLRTASILGRPLMSWAHDRVVATGVDQFRRRALA